MLSLSVLGKRLGKAMGTVAKEVKAMSQADILSFERSGEVTFSGHCLKLTDIKVLPHILAIMIHYFSTCIYLEIVSVWKTSLEIFKREPSFFAF